MMHISDENCLPLTNVQDSSQCSAEDATLLIEQASSPSRKGTSDRSSFSKAEDIDGLLL